MRIPIPSILLLLWAQTLLSQVQVEVDPPPHIKTVVFKGPTEDQFPVVELGEGIILEFDDLRAGEADYYYKIVHCDYDWTPSQLLKSQYLRGTDNQRITDYGNSYGTLQPYSNYRLAIPNEQVGLKVSGNHVLEVYDSGGILQFSRRFVVYRNAVQVAATVKRSRDFQYLNEKQVLQFTINTTGFQVVDPKNEVKVKILQNHYWPSALEDIRPQFTMGRELVYKYDAETAFWGGNEYLYFDTKDLRSTNFAISKIRMDDLYNHYLYPGEPRYDKPYTYYPDINGDFVVRTLQGDDPSREAEYTRVHFSLPYDGRIGLDRVYVVGRFNNYALTEENRMVYRPESGQWELPLLIKQGFYNYKYVVEHGNGEVDPNFISGNFHFTENNYLILVYYRNFGDQYDGIIGIGSANSANISN